MTCLSSPTRLHLALALGLAACASTAAWTSEAQAQTFYDGLTRYAEGPTESFGVSLIDYDADGDLDAYAALIDAPDQLWLNDGTGQFTPGPTFGTHSGQIARFADLNGDGALDAFVANHGGDGDRVYLGDGAGQLTDSGQSLGDAWATDADFGDVDGDGDLDVVVANTAGHFSALWLNDGAGQFTDSGQTLCSSTTGAAKLGDLNGDGDLDLYCLNNATTQDAFQPDAVYFGDGTGQLTDSGQAIGQSNGIDMALADIDGDGDLDAIVGNYDGPSAVWRNNGDGTFSQGATFSTGRVKGLVLADFNDDGDLDAFITRENSRDELWLGDGSGGFAPGLQPDGFGGSTASQFSAIGDLDGDGDLDAFQSLLGEFRVLFNTPDTDDDTIGDVVDNCVETPNTDQTDSDDDGPGDACDTCPDTPDPDQADSDGDGTGDACQAPTDNNNTSNNTPANNTTSGGDGDPDPADEGPSDSATSSGTADDGCGCAQLHRAPQRNAGAPWWALVALGLIGAALRRKRSNAG